MRFAVRGHFKTVLLILMAVFSVTVLNSAQLLAASLPPSEVQALDDYPNWVGSTCVPGSSNTTSTVLNSGTNVYILGDSITVRAQSAYQADFQAKGVTATIDGQSGRALDVAGTASENPGVSNLTTGLQAIAGDTNQIKSANAIVVALGTNGGDTTANMASAISKIKADNPNAPIYWVDTIVVNRPDYVSVINQANQAIYSKAQTLNYQIISWFKTVDPSGDPQSLTGSETDANGYIDPNPVSGLGVHPSIPTGVNALANLVVNSLTGGAGESQTCCTDSAVPGEVSVPITGNNVKDAYDFFVANGYSPAQSAGIVGNMDGGEDSGLNPTQGEIGGGGGYGIAQFTPPTYMIAWVTAKGEDPNSLKGQLDYILYQLNTSDAQVAADIKSTTTTYNSTWAFQGNENADAIPHGNYSGYERPKYEQANTPGNFNSRLAAANAILAKYGNGASGGGGGPGCSSTPSSTTPPPTPGVYLNPFRGVTNLRPERVDQGVDYDADGPVYALGDGTILNLINSGWDYGGYDAYISEQLTDGPAAGKAVYMAEGCIPTVTVGQKVTANTVICNFTNPPGPENDTGIETGWSAPAGTGEPLAQMFGGNGCCSTTAGVNYNDLLISLGTPSGSPITNPVIGTPLIGYPTW